MRAYERLLKYAKVYTTSDPESGTHPSAAREFDLAHLLVEEMKSIGIEDAFVDEHCYVYGSIPATKGCEKKPALGLIAHMDTAPDASGENVKPILHENYDGGDVTLPGTGMVMKTSTFPFLKELKGETLITTDGTTLLGADDKSGVAEILTAAETLIKKKLPHGKLCIAFTPDEEIGEGASLFDIPGFGADFAYTVDGGDVGGIEYENFNAAGAKISIQGKNIHPGYAKDKMINALQVACDIHALLPAWQRPEHTEGYEGFFHLVGMSGTVEQAEMSYIIRDHDRARFEQKKELLQAAVRMVERTVGEGVITLRLKDQYYNMKEMVEPHMEVVDMAFRAMKEAGVEPVVRPIRGGTDGSRLSYMGLPCPNLFTGGMNFHGKYEYCSLDTMHRAMQTILNLAQLWARR